MSLHWLFVAHIAVLGYWLGADLVINSTFRLVCLSDDMPYAQRDRLMDHVMRADQHVRYALVLQLGLGVMLAARAGYVPGGTLLIIAAASVTVLWLLFVEAVHRLRATASGARLAAIDRGSRYVLLLVLLAVASGLLAGSWPLPNWLRIKLALFAAIIGCGVGIRLVLVAWFRTWQAMADGATAEQEAMIKAGCHRATAILALLWACIAGIVVVSLLRPF